MEHDVWIAIISGLTATAVPTVRILIVWLQDKAQFASINQRFDDMRELWRAELRRFEEGLDARLKRLEEDEREHEANLPILRAAAGCLSGSTDEFRRLCASSLEESPGEGVRISSPCSQARLGDKAQRLNRPYGTLTAPRARVMVISPCYGFQAEYEP